MAVVNVGQLFQRKLSEHDNKFEEALNSSALELCNTVRSHCFAVMMANFVRVVNAVQDKAVKDVLTHVCALFAVSNILDDSNWTGLISPSQLQMVKMALEGLMNAIRPNAVAVVDAFDIPDRVLCSVIGRYDGNVYEALYEQALKSPLNQRDPFDGYKENLQPYLDVEFLKKGNKLPSKL